MPTTKQIVTSVQTKTGWNRDGTDKGILPVLNRMHRYMIDHDCENNVIMDDATGRPPTFDTTDGTFTYNCPANVRKVAAIMYDPEERRANYGQNQNAWNDRRFFYAGVWYREVFVSTRPRTRGANAVVRFPYNPQDTTGWYYRKAYREATDIVSEQIQVELEEQYHELLEDGILAFIRAQDYGDNEPYVNWKNERVSTEYWDEMNDNPTENSLFPLRIC